MNTWNKALSHYQENLPLWADLFLKMLSNIKNGHITIVTPEGNALNFGNISHGEHVNLHIRNWKFCEELFINGDIGLGKSYIEGYWECDHINKLIKLGIDNSKELERVIKGSLLKIIYYRFKHWLNKNSKKGSQKNIHAHYDLGNDFYKLWLDPSMTYSSAIFNNVGDDLSKAQERKYEKILGQLKLKAQDHILEVGCGWGGFMEYAARLGIKVTGVTISKEQYEFSKKRVEKFGGQALVLLQDYRDIEEKYDHIVSIEMFEALGQEYWGKYFQKLYSLLKPNGQLIIQSITINDDAFSAYRKGSDFIQQYIFPGGMLPSPKVFKSNALNKGFKYGDDFEFGLDYAKTLKIWEENFSKELARIKSLGFDEKFIRTWRFYLKYCQGGFEALKISVFQFNLMKQ